MQKNKSHRHVGERQGEKDSSRKHILYPFKICTLIYTIRYQMASIHVIDKNTQDVKIESYMELHTDGSYKGSLTHLLPNTVNNL